MEGEKILIVEADARVSELAVIKLSNAGYLVITAGTGSEALGKLNSTPPDLIAISYQLPDMSGYEVCAEIRKNSELRNIPIILLIDSQFDEDEFRKWGLAINDFLSKPFAPKTLLGRVNSQIVKVKVLKELNPLTELPGQAQFQEELMEGIKEGRLFNIIFCDLKGFTVFNKYYGYEQGNTVIRYVSDLIQDTLMKYGKNQPKIYHLGGDNFCILLEPGSSESICQEIIGEFDKRIIQFYDEEDQKRGGLVITNRRGVLEQSPIMTIVLGIVSNERRQINDWLEAELIGFELLKYAESMPGSNYFRDRRTS